MEHPEFQNQEVDNIVIPVYRWVWLFKTEELYVLVHATQFLLKKLQLHKFYSYE